MYPESFIIPLTASLRSFNIILRELAFLEGERDLPVAPAAFLLTWPSGTMPGSLGLKNMGGLLVLLACVEPFLWDRSGRSLGLLLVMT